jgi:hypothetical protein
VARQATVQRCPPYGTSNSCCGILLHAGVSSWERQGQNIHRIGEFCLGNHARFAVLLCAPVPFTTLQSAKFTNVEGENIHFLLSLSHMILHYFTHPNLHIQTGLEVDHEAVPKMVEQIPVVVGYYGSVGHARDIPLSGSGRKIVSLSH